MSPIVELASSIAGDIFTVSRQKRAQQYDITTLRSSMANLGGASDRMLVVDFPPVESERHWVIYEASAKFQCAYAATIQAVLWICKVDPTRRNYGVAAQTPANNGIQDTTALIDFPARSMILNLAIDQRMILPNQTQQHGVAAAGIGESGIILPANWFMRAILGTTGTADAAGITRPFAPADAFMEFSIGFLEEFTVYPCGPEGR